MSFYSSSHLHSNLPVTHLWSSACCSPLANCSSSSKLVTNIGQNQLPDSCGPAAPAPPEWWLTVVSSSGCICGLLTQCFLILAGAAIVPVWLCKCGAVWLFPQCELAGWLASCYCYCCCWLIRVCCLALATFDCRRLRAKHIILYTSHQQQRAHELRIRLPVWSWSWSRYWGWRCCSCSNYATRSRNLRLALAFHFRLNNGSAFPPPSSTVSTSSPAPCNVAAFRRTISSISFWLVLCLRLVYFFRIFFSSLLLLFLTFYFFALLPFPSFSLQFPCAFYFLAGCTWRAAAAFKCCLKLC